MLKLYEEKPGTSGSTKAKAYGESHVVKHVGKDQRPVSKLRNQEDHMGERHMVNVMWRCTKALPRLESMQRRRTRGLPGSWGPRSP